MIRSDVLNEQMISAAQQLRIDANRLCDRQLGGSYEADCRLAITRFDAALTALRDATIAGAEPQACGDAIHYFNGPYKFGSNQICRCGSTTWSGARLPSNWMALMEMIRDEHIESFQLTPAVVDSLRRTLRDAAPPAAQPIEASEGRAETPPLGSPLEIEQHRSFIYLTSALAWHAWIRTVLLADPSISEDMGEADLRELATMKVEAFRAAAPLTGPPQGWTREVDTFSRWSRQGHTDDRETPIDDYGKRVLSMVIRELEAER